MAIKIAGLEIHEKSGKYAPFFVCQVCDQPIRNNRCLVFHNDIKGVVAHAECMSQVTDNHKIYPMSEPIDYFLFNLIHNTGAKPKEFPYEFC